mmetsp:Transcript_15407/g.62012  ORF Transcript_15407/g.62012 Transcript_15407/m.62012 type:complete len:162 (-) Transcript_15407:1002-1487(-)
MGAAEAAILDAGAYAWSLMRGQALANAAPSMLSSRDSCAATLRTRISSPEEDAPSLFGVAVDGETPTQLDTDVAYYLLARGPYSWLGWGVWGMTWPPEVALPGLFGELDAAIAGQAPMGTLAEVAEGVFERVYSAALTVRLNCTAWNATFVLGSDPRSVVL